MDNRTKMLERVLNLRAKAENDASTESEAMVALNKAGKLMDAYHINEAELAMAEAEGSIVIDIVNKVSDSTSKNKTRKHKVILAFNGIQKFTNTKIVMWASGRYSSGKIEITGDRPDAEMANYLISLIKTSLDFEYANYKNTTVGIGYGAKASFQTAMALRINTRLLKMVISREKETRDAANGVNVMKIGDKNVDSSTALVMVNIAKQKEKEVNEAFHKANPRLSSIRMSTRCTNGTAHSAGNKAGNNVNLSRGIGSSSNNTIAA